MRIAIQLIAAAAGKLNRILGNVQIIRIAAHAIDAFIGKTHIAASAAVIDIRFDVCFAAIGSRFRIAVIVAVEIIGIIANRINASVVYTGNTGGFVQLFITIVANDTAVCHINTQIGFTAVGPVAVEVCIMLCTFMADICTM